MGGLLIHYSSHLPPTISYKKWKYRMNWQHDMTLKNKGRKNVCDDSRSRLTKTLKTLKPNKTNDKRKNGFFPWKFILEFDKKEREYVCVWWIPGLNNTTHKKKTQNQFTQQ